LRPSRTCHSYQPSAGTRQRALRYGSRHIGFNAACSDAALKQWPGGFDCFHHAGISPQRASASSSAESAALRMIDTVMVGATL